MNRYGGVLRPLFEEREENGVALSLLGKPAWMERDTALREITNRNLAIVERSNLILSLGKAHRGGKTNQLWSGTNR